MSKKKKKLSKKKRNKKIAIGSGIVVTVGILGFLGYKYFTPVKEYLSKNLNKIQGKNEQGEKLSSIKELADKGITQEEEKGFLQGTATYLDDSINQLNINLEKYKSDERQVSLIKDSLQNRQNTLNRLADFAAQQKINNSDPEYLCRNFGRCDGTDLNGNIL